MYPRRVFHCSVSRATSRPPKPVAVPDVGSRRPVSSRIGLDLPDPFGPRKPNTFPRGISNDTRSTAVNVPNLRVRLSQRRRISEEEEEDFFEGEEADGSGRTGGSFMGPTLVFRSLKKMKASSSVGPPRRLSLGGQDARVSSRVPVATSRPSSRNPIREAYSASSM